MGTRQLFTLHFLFLKYGIKNRLLWRTSVYIEVDFHTGTDAITTLNDAFKRVLSATTLEDLPLPDDIQIDNKYNEYIPKPLLKKQFIKDFLDLEGLKAIIKQYII
jgi:hypothetical protein